MANAHRRRAIRTRTSRAGHSRHQGGLVYKLTSHMPCGRLGQAMSIPAQSHSLSKVMSKSPLRMQVLQPWGLHPMPLDHNWGPRTTTETKQPPLAKPGGLCCRLWRDQIPEAPGLLAPGEGWRCRFLTDSEEQGFQYSAAGGPGSPWQLPASSGGRHLRSVIYLWATPKGTNAW